MPRQRQFDSALDLYEYCMALPRNENGCRIWDKGKVNGYAQVRLDGGERRVSRILLSFILNRGLKESCFVCHRCDIRACVEPDHLYEGTQDDNMQDAKRNGKIMGGDKFWIHQAKRKHSEETKRKMSEAARAAWKIRYKEKRW